MPLSGTMAYYPAFPPAIRPSGVGCIRVAHPCATLKTPESAYPVRLACIRPAASVHPEPGSNSSLYYCLAKFLSLNLGFRLDTRPQPKPRVPYPSRRFATALVFLCWPQTFKELFRFNFNALLPTLHLLSEVDCKGTTFLHTGNQIFQIFLIRCFI